MAKKIAKMKCPHCGSIFGLTQWQLSNNTKFGCPKCRRYNDGSTSMEDGVLIGVVLAKEEEREREEEEKRVKEEANAMLVEQAELAKELPKKLARWLEWVESPSRVWWRVEGLDYNVKLPDFSTSLDACFKWLVPKLNSLGLNVVVGSEYDSLDPFYAEITEYNTRMELDTTSAYAVADTPALALCKAVDQLISKEEHR